ncbi:NaCP60E [Symbiodinium pilosum]|uniref:NaCP60E protein n=1 Tax=Symbiodinium pilosum TaxID=2952 RepID=A0A812LEK8_SYMPI|nr:NaCP60E [Symbiodinium pilosum]
MQNPTGLRKGLVAQWKAAQGTMEKFAFLKAFLLDREMASIEIQPYYEELSEDKTKEKYSELPLCRIREQYEHLPGGKQYVADLIASQKGKKHPQSNDDEMKLYKVFVGVDTTSYLASLLDSATVAFRLYD